MDEINIRGEGTSARALNRVTGYVRRCVEDYGMIEDGDRIAVGVSGGKDSLVLLGALANMRGYYPKKFDLHAVTVDLGFDGMDFSPVEEMCDLLRVPYTLQSKNIGQVVFEDGRDKNHCALCSKMRRGALHDLITELGIRKIALAHHFDDAVETFLLSLIYEGRLNCFQPVTYMDRAGVTQIRPMLYVKEDSIVRLASICRLPVVHNTCPMNGVSKRQEVKVLLKTAGERYPDLKNKIFGSMQRLPLPGWER